MWKFWKGVSTNIAEEEPVENEKEKVERAKGIIGRIKASRQAKKDAKISEKNNQEASKALENQNIGNKKFGFFRNK